VNTNKLNINKKELTLIPKEIEKDLRKIGFDWCDETPTIELVCKWFRDVKGYYIDVTT